MAEKTNLTSDEVSALLMVSPLTVCEWVQKGVLHAYVAEGGQHRFSIDDIQHFAKQRGLLFTCADEERIRILIIDDDIPATRSLVELLETLSETVEVTAAHTAFEAGRMLVEFNPDVVLLDLLMPRNDGYEICRRIRSDYATRHVRVIAMSEDGGPEHKQRILMAGAESFFPKPVNNQRLLDTIGLCLKDPGTQQSLQF